ncbi:MAG: hypothetical protein GVX78_03620 [Bacteroidetes bacterium]|jgi:hypothetical protein|nr:hypothetical protein [Bacteroidota bacterium]
MKITNEFSLDAKGIKVLSIILFGLVVTLTCVLMNEKFSLMLPNFVIGSSAVALNRILAPPQKSFLADKFKVLRTITEFLFALGVIGVLVMFFLYSEWFILFPILMAPAFLLSLYLVIHYAFGATQNEERL